MTSPSPLTLGAPWSLGDPSVLHTARMDRLTLGVTFLPTTTALGAVSGIVHGPPGSVGDLTLVSDAVLRVDPFVAVVQGTHNSRQGQYVVPNEQQRDLAIVARDASLTRRSLIVVRVADSAEAGVAPSATTNGAWLERVDGTLVASNPALPALPANAVALGELTVPSAANGGTPVTLTPYRPRTGTRHGVLPVFDDTSTVPGHGEAPGTYVDQLRMHPTRGLERWSGAVWQPPQRVGFARLFAYATVARLGFAAGWQDIDLNAESLDTHGAHTTGAGLVVGQRYFTCPAGQAGRYSVEGGVTFDGATVGAAINSRILRNDAVFRGGAGAGASFAANGSASITGTKIVDLAVGDTLHVQGYCASGWATGVYADGGSWMSVERID